MFCSYFLFKNSLRNELFSYNIYGDRVGRASLSVDSGVRLRFSHEAHNRACCQKKIALTKAIFFFSEINPAHLLTHMQARQAVNWLCSFSVMIPRSSSIRLKYSSQIWRATCSFADVVDIVTLLRAFQVSLFQLPKVERVPCAVYQPVQLLTGGFLVGWALDDI